MKSRVAPRFPRAAARLRSFDKLRDVRRAPSGGLIVARLRIEADHPIEVVVTQRGITDTRLGVFASAPDW
jgi:hypothetical protein